MKKSQEYTLTFARAAPMPAMRSINHGFLFF